MTVNIENVRKVRDAIAKGLVIQADAGKVEVGFNLREYVNIDPPRQYRQGPLAHTCGTVACIGGYAALLGTIEDDGTTAAYDIAVGKDQADLGQRGANFLGLNSYQKGELFIPSKPYQDGEHVCFSDVRPETAIAVLDHLIETGEIDWGSGDHYINANGDPTYHDETVVVKDYEDAEIDA